MQSTCIYAECETKTRSRGLCESHYRKWRYGSIEVPDVPAAQVAYDGEACSVSACTRVAVARDWCLMHYKRWRRWGSPTGSAPTMTREESFARRTRLGEIPRYRPGLGECIEWAGLLNHGGYGIFTHRPSGIDNRLAHRVALAIRGVDIPAGMVVDHLCRNRACVNTRHLEVVTNEENLRRGAGYRLQNGMDNSCINGHEYTPENTYLNPNKTGDIRCMECARNRDRIRSRKKAA